MGALVHGWCHCLIQRVRRPVPRGEAVEGWSLLGEGAPLGGKRRLPDFGRVT